MPMPLGSGAGSDLPSVVLILTGISTVVAVLVSSFSIFMHLKNYRKPSLQRMVVRIMVMVPLYAVSSCIALHSLEAAFVIDAIRDIYEAFVIYCFFVLLLSYIGGERALFILLHGRAPKKAPFPLSLFRQEIDVSDPYTFLFLKRGILQYVQVKPILAAMTLILKATGTYNEGDFKANSGYLYVSVVYNVSICLALYCLAVFWLCIHDDLKRFRPVPKFLCVKGILFFSFWQSIAISALVAADVITRLGPYRDPEHISVGLNDTLICLEMPLFAVAHMFAFSHKDFVDPRISYVARMPMYYAFRDAFGLLDVVEDSKVTLRGEGMDYREFEPVEGFMHLGEGRVRRIRAGLRYSKGGKRKYWLPKPARDTQPPGQLERNVNRVIARVAGPDQVQDVHAPLLSSQAANVVHLASDLQDSDDEADPWVSKVVDNGFELPFGDLDPSDEELFEHGKKYIFGDYNYPVIDISSETAKVTVWEDEERILRDAHRIWFPRLRGQESTERHRSSSQGYGTVGSTLRSPKGRADGISDDVPGRGKPRARNDDHETFPSPGSGDLNWRGTNAKGRGPTSPSFPYPRFPPSQSSIEGGARRTDRLLWTPTSWSHIDPRSKTPVKAKTSVHALPPDAVDLVVEDSDAEAEERERERKGGPIQHGGFRRVYRRGFIAPGDERLSARGIEDHEAHVTKRVRSDETHDAVKNEDIGQKHDDSSTVPDSEGTIVREESPPLRVRILRHEFDDFSDNPWA